MKVRTKIFFGYLIIVLAGFYFFSQWIIDDVRKNYLESVEESMVDSAYILAGILETDIKHNTLQLDNFEKAFLEIHKQQFAAKIYDLTKTNVNLNVYVTDDKGTVLFDSGKASNKGQNFSKWNDVRITLEGKYGARATRKIKDDPKSTVLYVSAPIKLDGQIVGVLTVYKSVNFISQFIDNAKEKIIDNAIIASVMVFVFGLLLAAWLTRPIHKLTYYAQCVRDRKKAKLPYLGRGEIRKLGEAFEEMREALEGKKYIENYVQHLTHELKSPISAIKGALEFLEDNQLQADRKERLLKNLNFETNRMQQLVDRMLQLTTLESQKTLHKKEAIDLVTLLQELLRNIKERFPEYKFELDVQAEEAIINGERFLLYQAFDNVLCNAVDFSPKGSVIKIEIQRNSRQQIVIRFLDEGSGIPDYAVDKVFDKFYSLPRPEGGTKSSGLGLSIVKAIAELHHCKLSLTNRNATGTQVTFIF